MGQGLPTITSVSGNESKNVLAISRFSTTRSAQPRETVCSTYFGPGGQQQESKHGGSGLISDGSQTSGNAFMALQSYGLRPTNQAKISQPAQSLCDQSVCAGPVRVREHELVVEAVVGISNGCRVGSPEEAMAEQEFPADHGKAA